MPLEQGVSNLLIIGFIFFVLVLGISTITLWIKNKRNSAAYLFILVHLGLLSTAFIFFMNAINLGTRQEPTRLQSCDELPFDS